jgi:putative photosynthetic complex assembly protein
MPDPDVHRKTRRAIALLGIALLACVAAVAAARLGGYEPEAVDYGSATASARLGFSDIGAGAVRIYDWESGVDLRILAPGEGSFVRGVLRSLVRERRSRGLLTEDPFTISRYEGGSLILEDPLTGQRIELQAFGPSNAGAFAALLAATRQAS